MIEAADLVRTYTMGKVQVHALRGVSLRIERGEFVGVTGSSGSGKSTLLHLLGLLDRPTSGAIAIDGVDTGSLTDEQRALFRLTRLGYVFQEYALVPELTVFENVMLPFMVRNDPPDASEEKVHEILGIIGLAERTGHLQSELSGGEQQRVAVARAVAGKPSILYADEPCANLDSENSRIILDLFAEINREMDQTIVMVSHEEWHTRYFDRIIALRDGKLVE
ncbi:cell division transporter, atp-binding protein ftse [hydrocarbon metagenome]|uniref:Cell division transporter, atp-binding protein ftse n=1 Tax=hydrocarbon metagenome TaxID=938273 RepID=A0A0W8EZU1_9ZZZZ